MKNAYGMHVVVHVVVVHGWVCTTIDEAKEDIEKHTMPQ